MGSLQRGGGLAGMVAALFFHLSPAVLAQAPNPAVRGTTTTPRVATQNRAPLQVTQRAASGTSPFPAGCGDTAGTVYIGAEVEPHVAANPLDSNNLVGLWQQDRFSNGASRGLVTGLSLDGGATWSLRQVPWSLCSGGEYQRATDPWVTFSPDGTAHQIALGVSGESFTATGVSAILVSRSTDGGITWSPVITVIRDAGADFFNDKETITADPLDSRFVYAVWDRLRSGANGPTLFSRTTDGGLTWEAARAIYDPGGTNQTIGNLIRILPDGTLVNMLAQLIDLPNGTTVSSIHVIRSTDRGLTWSSPILVSPFNALGARDVPSGTIIRDGSIVPQMAVGPDGTLSIVWQDARFTQIRDAIAFSRSIDGGLTWSAPVRVNADPGVVAFTPQVHVRADGIVAVTYYDLRSNTASTATLLTDYWLARSSDGVNWTETRLSEPFDLATAPRAGGQVFLGDYTGLASAGTTFIAFFGRTTGDLANRTDIIAARAGPATAPSFKRFAEAEPAMASYRAAPLADVEPSDELRREVSENIARAMERRVPGWAKSKGRDAPPVR